MSQPVIIEDVGSLGLKPSTQPVYDRPFDLESLYVDPRTGSEHYVVRYRPGTRAKAHRHTAAHTMIVLGGHLVANGHLLGAGGYAHFPGGTAMLHEPGPDSDCTFILIFDGPFDVEVLESSDSETPKLISDM